VAQVRGDLRFRLSVNLYGAPALTLKEFRNYQQDLIVGASLQVSMPAGLYDSRREHRQQPLVLQARSGHFPEHRAVDA
jgi:hypothetical protein